MSSLPPGLAVGDDVPEECVHFLRMRQRQQQDEGRPYALTTGLNLSRDKLAGHHRCPGSSTYHASCRDHSRHRMHCVSRHRWPQAGQTPPVSKVFQAWPQVHIQRSSRPGCQAQRGQRMRDRPAVRSSRFRTSRRAAAPGPRRSNRSVLMAGHSEFGTRHDRGWRMAAVPDSPRKKLGFSQSARDHRSAHSRTHYVRDREAECSLPCSRRRCHTAHHDGTPRRPFHCSAAALPDEGAPTVVTEPDCAPDSGREIAAARSRTPTDVGAIGDRVLSPAQLFDQQLERALDDLRRITARNRVTEQILGLAQVRSCLGARREPELVTFGGKGSDDGAPCRSRRRRRHGRVGHGGNHRRAR